MISGSWKTCLLSYISNNYIGFRSVSIPYHWEDGYLAHVVIGEKDAAGMCRYLSTDAFVEWEDRIWECTSGHPPSVRGLVASPFTLHAFEVPLTEEANPVPMEAHSTDVCQTTYPPSSRERLQNPVTSLVIHPPPEEKPPAPYYTLTRLAATQTNHDWWDTNIPVPSMLQDSTGSTLMTNEPGWCEEVIRRSQMALPERMQELALNDESDESSEKDYERQDDTGSEHEIAAIERDDENSADLTTRQTSMSKPGALEEEMDIEGDAGGGFLDADDDSSSEEGGLRSLISGDEEEKATVRAQIHGLATSPGHGVSAILLTQQWTQRPTPGSWYKSYSRVIFGKREPRGPMLEDQLAEWEPGRVIGVVEKERLSAEARLFEWMYGGGPMPRGIVQVPQPSPVTQDDAEGDDGGGQAVGNGSTNERALGFLDQQNAIRPTKLSHSGPGDEMYLDNSASGTITSARPEALASTEHKPLTGSKPGSQVHETHQQMLTCGFPITGMEKVKQTQRLQRERDHRSCVEGPLRGIFRNLIENRTITSNCPDCKSPLDLVENFAKCDRGHDYGECEARFP